MKLSFEQIRNITTGAVDLSSDAEGISFFRFTKEQIESYKARNESYYNNSFATAGIKLCFKTDSEKLYIAIGTSIASSRRYFALDVLVNGEYIGSIDDFSDREIEKNYHAMKCELGSFSKTFTLGNGVKEVCVQLPWSVVTKLYSIELDDGAFLEAVKPEKKLLAFGDSITQGYDALHPSNRYVAKLADALGAEEFNKGIGGERFWPNLAAIKDDYNPDYIAVAYGTNDWRYSELESREKFDGFSENCKLFFENLRKNYSDAKIFVITPLWRADFEDASPDWKFEKTEEIIRRFAEMQDVTVIRGTDLLPHDTDLFADLKLHPNDEGFRYYFENLYDIIKTKI